MLPTDRLGTPGLALMILGLFIMYWGFGIFRGETGIGSDGIEPTPGFGGGGSGDWFHGEGGGGSGSF
jgi:hypothetical protein